MQSISNHNNKEYDAFIIGIDNLHIQKIKDSLDSGQVTLEISGDWSSRLQDQTQLEQNLQNKIKKAPKALAGEQNDSQAEPSIRAIASGLLFLGRVNHSKINEIADLLISGISYTVGVTAIRPTTIAIKICFSQEKISDKRTAQPSSQRVVEAPTKEKKIPRSNTNNDDKYLKNNNGETLYPPKRIRSGSTVSFGKTKGTDDIHKTFNRYTVEDHPNKNERPKTNIDKNPNTRIYDNSNNTSRTTKKNITIDPPEIQTPVTPVPSPSVSRNKIKSKYDATDSAFAISNQKRRESLAIHAEQIKKDLSDKSNQAKQRISLKDENTSNKTPADRVSTSQTPPKSRPQPEKGGLKTFVLTVMVAAIVIPLGIQYITQHKTKKLTQRPSHVTNKIVPQDNSKAAVIAEVTQKLQSQLNKLNTKRAPALKTKITLFLDQFGRIRSFDVNEKNFVDLEILNLAVKTIQEEQHKLINGQYSLNIIAYVPRVMKEPKSPAQTARTIGEVIKSSSEENIVSQTVEKDLISEKPTKQPIQWIEKNKRFESEGNANIKEVTVNATTSSAYRYNFEVLEVLKTELSNIRRLLTLTVSTNWKSWDMPPEIFIATEEEYRLAGIPHDASFTASLSTTFDENTGEITVKSNRSAPYGSQMILLRVLRNGSTEYEPIVINVTKN